MRHRFIVFEGVEGSGKTTQVNMLAEALRRRGLKVTVTHEPGGTPAGEAVREVLLARRVDMSSLCELFLFCASRTQHVRDVIAPALRRGRVVISDRYELSSVVYQGYAGDVGVPLVEQLNNIATGGVHPDLTVVLDIDPAEGLRRNRAEQAADRIEAKELEFHRRVREGYLIWAASHPRSCIVIDATLPPEQIHRRVLERLGLG